MWAGHWNRAFMDSFSPAGSGVWKLRTNFANVCESGTSPGTGLGPLFAVHVPGQTARPGAKKALYGMQEVKRHMERKK